MYMYLDGCPTCVLWYKEVIRLAMLNILVASAEVLLTRLLHYPEFCGTSSFHSDNCIAITTDDGA